MQWTSNIFMGLMGTYLLIGAGLLSAADTAPGPRTAPKPPALGIFPKKITLEGAYSDARAIVSRTDHQPPKDVTSAVRWSIANEKVAIVDSDGVVRPKSNGITRLSAAFHGGAASAVVEVRGIRKGSAPSFVNEVLPVLTRSGCNMGACHGAAQGKGGFKLSLQGFDADADYESLVRGSKFRRVTPIDPENSLLLRKPLLAVAHKGGKRLRVDSAEYRILRDWIGFGMPGPNPADAKVLKLEVIPVTRSLPVGKSQRVIVHARFRDGTVRDVTSQALFSAEDESVARVSASGEAAATGPGEAAVLVRYQDLVATARIISPFAKTLSARAPEPPDASPIDRLVNRKLTALGLPSSPRCSDSDFIRRAYLDLIGAPPTADEARRFLSARHPQRREKLIDELLERREFVDFWSYRWADLLRVSRAALKDKGAYALYNWIRQSVAENKPWDRFAREIILAKGGSFEYGPANYFRANTRPEELTETTAQAFLGVRIQCAKCHNHPYEKWTQNQYYQLAAFFAQSRGKGRGDETVVMASGTGDVRHPKTGKTVIPAALGSPPIASDYSGDRREALAEWLTSPRNPFFARTLVNRLWRHFMGRGLVEPVDDMRATNPPSNEPLLEWLAEEFMRNGFDIRRIMRTIMLSEAYQRSAEPVKGNERDARYHSVYPFKRLRAEQLMDALTSVIGSGEKFEGFPPGFRASELPVTTVPSYFLDLFGRPARSITCECERGDEANLGQILHLMNNSGINARIGSKDGRIAKLIESRRSNPQVVEELYLAAFARYPTGSEAKERASALDKAKDRKQAAEDLLWALVNSKEFLFNH